MRIVGGNLRGRALASPGSSAIRPTTDRARESLFNILAHNHSDNLVGGRVLDCFAGTGALGLEALSRGAAFSVFIEMSVEGRGLLRQNIENLGQTGQTKVFRRDATKPGPLGTMKPFSLIFADPPYGKGLGEKAAESLLANGWMQPDATFVLEEESQSAPEGLNGFHLTDQRPIGGSVFSFYKPARG